MKRPVSVWMLFITATLVMQAQERVAVPLAVEGRQDALAVQDNSQHELHPYPGCRIFMEKNAEFAKYLREHPEIEQRRSLMKRSAWSFNVGDKGPIQGSGWWALNNESGANYVVASTCRAKSDHAYVFVEDALWNNNTVTQAAVDSIVANWESRTPATSSKGIYQTDIETFGDPPNVDADQRIIILIMDIIDGGSISGGYIAGYFHGVHEYPDGTFTLYRSNFAEIFFLDGKESNVKTSGGLNAAMGTIAHEFQHMINFKYNAADNDEIDSFSNESLSEVASLVCGFGYPAQHLYTNTPDVYLFGWNNTLADYSRAARWSLYLWNQFPGNFLKMWTQGNGQTFGRINGALLASTPTTTRQFADVFDDFVVANYLQDLSINGGRHGYTYQSSLTKPTGVTYVNPNTNGAVNATVNRLAADYISFTSGSNLTVTFTSQSSGLAIRAIKSGASGNAVDIVPLGSPYNIPDFGTTYTSVTFVVINTTTGATPISYSYSTTGNVSFQQFELKWDNTEPNYYRALAPLDTVCVVFPAVSGARLDSIRVALRRIGSMNGGVWTLSTSAGSPLGTPIIKPITVSTTFTTPVVAGAPNPYPNPYPNWRSVDLRSFNHTLNQDFAIAFWFPADTSTASYIMSTEYASMSAFNSFAYLHSPSSGSPGWYYIGSGTTIDLFLIRAYASIGTPTGTEVIELTPASFSLKQNYPNPFNPSTTIRYELPERSYVKLQILDMLGRVVKTVVDSEQLAGSHETRWDGTNFAGQPASSGVYFYKLETGRFKEIKRMVLMK